MPAYEMYVIASMDASAGYMANLIKKTSEKMIASGGVLRRVDHLGLRPLAYRMRSPQTKKWHEVGRYLRIGIQANPVALKEFETRLKNDDETVRLMTLRQKFNLAPYSEWKPAPWNRQMPFDPAITAFIRKDSDLDHFAARTLLQKGKLTPSEVHALAAKYARPKENTTEQNAETPLTS